MGQRETEEGMEDWWFAEWGRVLFSAGLVSSSGYYAVPEGSQQSGKQQLVPFHPT